MSWRTGEIGRERILHMTVTNLEEILNGEKLDLEESWRRYMIDHRFTEKEFNLHDAPQAENLRDTIYNWCLGENKAWSTLRSTDIEAWRLSKLKELKNFKFTKDTVWVAVDFHTFTMAWNSSFTYDAFAYALVISRSGYNWPDQKSNQLMEKIQKWSNSKCCMKFEEYKHGAENIIKNPYQDSGIQLQSRMGKYDRDSCHINILDNFMKFSFMLDLSFLDEEISCI
ncbi:hypothetical protein PGTUg99_021998 [Puccinia graminis f. sp. tritici]|uniref:Uncharacterized protein n=1 Tax=Puccinia graminis f. sp. tritici TaxID=56615 RepID=A0A5B0NXU5_PUCGR|nr:hypothetical protein PGTUg99_021998 [Puccinia graminis f. sp. tritici]